MLGRWKDAITWTVMLLGGWFWTVVLWLMLVMWENVAILRMLLDISGTDSLMVMVSVQLLGRLMIFMIMTLMWDRYLIVFLCVKLMGR